METEKRLIKSIYLSIIITIITYVITIIISHIIPIREEYIFLIAIFPVIVVIIYCTLLIREDINMLYEKLKNMDK